MTFLRFFSKSVDFDEVLVMYVRVLSRTFSRKSEKLRRCLKVKRPSWSTRRKVNTTQITLVWKSITPGRSMGVGRLDVPYTM